MIHTDFKKGWIKPEATLGLVWTEKMSQDSQSYIGNQKFRTSFFHVAARGTVSFGNRTTSEV